MDIIISSSESSSIEQPSASKKSSSVDEQPSASKKRIKMRTTTRYTTIQLEKMKNVAISLGWKMPGITGAGNTEVLALCREIGVTRQQFRCWVYHNKKKHA
ncbi:hypothetical protein FRX31_002556 [Thalictrum thalictroides]|uniref:Homeobox domain-containing protein n=1 Tax=Thalictrum thalictroides TaxID=46969 RepID=A0A7J6XFL2_THATH|nr:hypothetical protein FRX31_002556 [Thalictrum thalictroides]